MTARVCRLALSLLVLGLCFSGDARAATYAAISDAELVRRSPLIVHAEVLGERTRLQRIGARELPVTLTLFKSIEILKGALPGETFTVRLPGGTVGDVGWWVPGAPRFLPQQEAVLFLFPLADQSGEHGLTEFALSKFDVLEDSRHHRFAVRSVFQSGEERLLSPEGSGEAAPDEVRDLEPFLSALRVAGRGEPLPTIEYRQPKGSLRLRTRGLTPLWVNIGGREPGDCSGRVPCLIRWFWDTGASPNGVVTIVGAQTNLSDGSDGTMHVANAVSGWTSIPQTDVRFSGPSPSGNVTVNLDVENQSSGAWMGAIDCGAGTLGFGGPSFRLTPISFKGDSYFPAQSAFVDMRKNVCASRYSVATFRTVVLHEMGHDLGLGHPDMAQSNYSTTTMTDWNNAVMRSVVQNVSPPDTPRTDDIQAVQYYYGTQQQPPPEPPGPCVQDPTTMCLSDGRFRVRTNWRRTDGATGQGMAVRLTADTGYFWFFDQANVEMVVKVLNTCSFSNRFWVFAGGLTNVEVTMTVTDTRTGIPKVYMNPQGTPFRPIQDTEAFATCP